LALAAKVASGRLRADAVVQGLVSSFLHTFRDNLKHKRYQTSSKHANFGAIQDALLSLGHVEEVSSLLRLFCVNDKQLPRLQAGLLQHAPTCSNYSFKSLQLLALSRWFLAFPRSELDEVRCALICNIM
jgi:hypothetical protein